MTEPIEIPPGTYVLPKTIALTGPGWQDALRSALQEQNPPPDLVASIAAIIYKYVSAYDNEEDVGDADFDGCWSLEQICTVIARRVAVAHLVREMQVSIDDLAKALFAALCAGTPDGLVIGEPLEAYYSAGELMSGVLLDGRFDLKAAACFLLGCLGER